MTGWREQGERQVLERVRSPQGELVLRRAGPVLEIISNGVFLMDTSDGRSERLLAGAALDRCPAPAPAVLLGGLGAGFSLAEVAGRTAPARIDVVEISAAVIGWHTTHLRHIAAPAWSDPRVRVIEADLVAWLRRRRGPYDVACLDIDNGPGWTVTEANRGLYGDAGLRRVRASLNPGGVAAVWSAAEDRGFEARFRGHFADVEVRRVPVARGEPDIVYLGSRPATGAAPPAVTPAPGGPGQEPRGVPPR